MRVLSDLKPSKTILMDKGCVVAVSDEKMLGRVEKEGFKDLLEELEEGGEK